MSFVFIFNSFVCLITLAGNFFIMMNSSGESGLFALFLILEEKLCLFSLLSVMLAVDLSCVAFIILRYITFMHGLLKVFILKVWWIFILSNASSIKCYWDDHVISILHSVNTAYHIHLCMLSHPCLPGINSAGLWCMIFLIFC